MGECPQAVQDGTLTICNSPARLLNSYDDFADCVLIFGISSVKINLEGWNLEAFVNIHNSFSESCYH